MVLQVRTGTRAAALLLWDEQRKKADAPFAYSSLHYNSI